MNLFRISLRNLRVRALSTSLTTVSIAVGAFLLAAMILLIHETERKYKASTSGFRAIVGPKEGSPLDLVLNVVFNLGVSPGVVPLSTYEEIRANKLPWKNRTIPVEYAIPIAKGDNFKGFPILGTIPPVNPAYADRDPEARNAWVRDMNVRIKAMAAPLQVPIADIYDAYTKASVPLTALYSDFLHPNEQGYALMAQTWFQAITRPPTAASTASAPVFFFHR